MEEVVEEAEALDQVTEEVLVVGQWEEGDTEGEAAEVETDLIPTELLTISTQPLMLTNQGSVL